MESDLPDSILWFIFSKLSFKDHVKTCTLSKHWLREWKLSSTHLNFDLYNTFHCTTLPKDIPQRLQSQFTARLDQFMLHYQHATISSIRVKFPLDNYYRDVIDRLISQGIAKGVKHVELLFSHEPNHTDFNLEIEPYRFSFPLLSNADSLTYLHLENCLLVAPMKFYGLKNLKTLILQLIQVDPYMFETLFSNCMHLVDVTLDNCNFNWRTRIESSTLIHLKIVSSSKYIKWIDIIAPNLASLEYSWKGGHAINVVAHRLSRFTYRARMIGLEGSASWKNLTTIVLDELHLFWFTQFLFKECLQLEDVTFKNFSMPYDMEITSTKLLHLKIIDCGFESHNKISIDAENLSSFEYSGLAVKFSIKAPKLSKVFWNAVVREENRDFLGPIPELHQIENLAIITSHSHISKLNVLARFQNLKQLELFMDDPYIEFFSILDVLMASQHLKKFSLTIKHTYWFGRLIQRKSANFFHNELKYVELHGCVSTQFAIEFARKLLRNVSSLKKITFSSLDKFYVGAETWTKGSGSDSCWYFDRNFIFESLKDEVKGQSELIIL